jgi:hypothetical protein
MYRGGGATVRFALVVPWAKTAPGYTRDPVWVTLHYPFDCVIQVFIFRRFLIMT